MATNQYKVISKTLKIVDVDGTLKGAGELVTLDDENTNIGALYAAQLIEDAPRAKTKKE